MYGCACRGKYFSLLFHSALFTISAYRLASKCIAEISRNRDSTWSNDNTRGRHLQHSSNDLQLENQDTWNTSSRSYDVLCLFPCARSAPEEWTPRIYESSCTLLSSPFFSVSLYAPPPPLYFST